MRHVLAAALALAVIPAAVPAASGTEHWSAASKTAMGITGDITLSPTRLVAAGKVFSLAVAADTKTFSTNSGPKSARILKVTKPVNPTLLHGNKLCGPSAARWIAVYRGDAGKSLNLAVFTGTAQPTGQSDPGLCGTFWYTR